MVRTFIVDTDGGADDAVALMMLFSQQGIEVAAITAVAGNVNVEQAAKNVSLITELCNADVPVFIGASQPIMRSLKTAEAFHGADGLSNYYFPGVRRPQETIHAIDALIEIIASHSGITLVSLGPLTNIALALAKSPEVFKSVERCVVMGGAPCCAGNITPAAEYNMWVDPEAAEAVFRSALPIELVGWQLSRGAAVLTGKDIDAIKELSNARAEYALKFNACAERAYLQESGTTGIPLADAVAMAIAIDPSIGVDFEQLLGRD